jgi:hypothetical protein
MSSPAATPRPCRVSGCWPQVDEGLLSVALLGLPLVVLRRAASASSGDQLKKAVLAPPSTPPSTSPLTHWLRIPRWFLCLLRSKQQGSEDLPALGFASHRTPHLLFQSRIHPLSTSSLYTDVSAVPQGKLAQIWTSSQPVGLAAVCLSIIWVVTRLCDTASH